MTQTDISDSTQRSLAAACGFGMVALLFAAVAAQSPAGPLPAKDGPIAAVIAWGAHRQAPLLTVADLVIEPLQLFNRSVEDAAILPAFALTFWVLAASMFMVWTAVRIGRPSY